MEIPEQIRDEYPFKPNWFSLGSLKLHYVDEGKGRPIVMLHGNPTWSFYYRNVVKALRDTNRCLALDHMGCGLSSKPQDYPYNLKQHIANAVAWIKGLKIDSFDLIIHDWGGAIGMGVAKEFPERVGKIVILNTAAFFVDRIPARIKICRIPVLGALMVRGLNGFAWPALAMAVTKPLVKRVREGYLFPYDNWQNRIANLRFVQDIPTSPSQETFMGVFEIERFLPKLAGHSMLIGWGEKDFCFNKLFLEQWKHIYPKARVLSYPNSGHYILEDEKETLIPEIERFLRK